MNAVCEYSRYNQLIVVVVEEDTVRRLTFSFLGVLLIVASVAGILISLVGIIGLWRIERTAKTSVMDTLDLLGTTLQATTEGMSIASGSLDQADASLDAVTDMLKATGQSVQDMVPFIETMRQMTTVDLPDAISSTKIAFQSAQTSALVIDNTLAILNAIPFISTPAYEEQPPLSVAFGGVTSSLDPISESLQSMDESLSTTKDNLSEIDGAFENIADSMNQIKTSLSDAQGVSAQYLEVLEDLSAQVESSRTKLPATLNSIAWFLTIALIWLALTQIGLLMQGAEMLGLNFVKEMRKADHPLDVSGSIDEQIKNTQASESITTQDEVDG